MTTSQIQEDIINEFLILDGDRWMTIEYLIELGRKLPAMPEEEKVDHNLIKGCMSKVYLTADLVDDKVRFAADSNTDTIKGLISLLVRVLNNRSPEEIINADLYFFEKLGLERYITSQRSGGFAAMIKQMKFYALALKTKQEVKS